MVVVEGQEEVLPQSSSYQINIDGNISCDHYISISNSVFSYIYFTFQQSLDLFPLFPLYPASCFIASLATLPSAPKEEKMVTSEINVLTNHSAKILLE